MEEGFLPSGREIMPSAIRSMRYDSLGETRGGFQPVLEISSRRSAALLVEMEREFADPIVSDRGRNGEVGRMKFHDRVGTATVDGVVRRRHGVTERSTRLWGVDLIGPPTRSDRPSERNRPLSTG
jgi:hypothetical protein